MKTFVLVVALALSAIVPRVSAADAEDLYYGGFDGIWKGELCPIEAPGNPFAEKISAFLAKNPDKAFDQ